MRSIINFLIYKAIPAVFFIFLVPEIEAQTTVQNDTAGLWIYKGRVDAIENNDLDSAIKYCNYNIEKFRRQHNKIMEAYFLYWLGGAYDMKGQFEKAYNCYFDALSVFEEQNDKKGEAGCLNCIGVVLWEQSGQVKGEGKRIKLKKALGYLDQALVYYTEIDFKDGTGTCLMNKGIVFNDMANATSDSLKKTEYFDKAYNYYSEALKVYDLTGDKQGAAECKMNMALMFYEKFVPQGKKVLNDNQFELIERHLKSARQGFYDVRDTYGQSMALKNRATIRINKAAGMRGKARIDMLHSALSFADKALHYADSVNALYLKYDAYYELFRAYKLLGKFDKALKNYELYSNLKDTVHQKEQFKVMEEMEARYNTEKKEQQLKIKDIQNNRQKVIIAGVSIILFISLLLGIVLLRFYKQKQKANLILNEKNEELRRLNNTQNRLISIISHDLKAPVSAFLSITNSLKSDFDKMTKKDILYYINRLLNASMGLKMQFDNLLNWALSQKKGIKVDLKTVYLYIIAEKVFMVLSEAANEKGVDLINAVDENLEIKTDPKLLSIILNNLVSNAIKFTKQGGKVELGATKENEGIRIWVSDTGIGMSREECDAVFKPDAIVSKNENSGSGLGLKVSKEIVEKLGGEISIRSKINSGTTFYLFFYEQE